MSVFSGFEIICWYFHGLKSYIGISMFDMKFYVGIFRFRNHMLVFSWFEIICWYFRETTNALSHFKLLICWYFHF